MQLSSGVSNLACFHPVLPLCLSLCLHCRVYKRTCISMARLTLHYPFARKRQEPEWPQPSRANFRGAVVMRRRHRISAAKTFYLIRSAFPTSAAQQHRHDGSPCNGPDEDCRCRGTMLRYNVGGGVDGQGRIFIRWPDNYQMGFTCKDWACRVRLEKTRSGLSDPP